MAAARPALHVNDFVDDLRLAETRGASYQLSLGAARLMEIWPSEPNDGLTVKKGQAARSQKLEMSLTGSEKVGVACAFAYGVMEK